MPSGNANQRSRCFQRSRPENFGAIRIRYEGHESGSPVVFGYPSAGAGSRGGPDGGWGLAGHANTNAELVSAARAQIAELATNPPGS